MIRGLLVVLFLLCAVRAEEKFGPYAEPDFPVLTSTVDFTDWEKLGFPKDNIAVRGLIIKLPHDLYVCFDQDLLRVAGIWQGEPGGKFLTCTTIPAISYNAESKKSEAGQKDLPKPIGKPLMATGLMPGWILKAAKDVTPEDLKDPRPPGPDPKEPGRGPLPAGNYRWLGWHNDHGRVLLSYRCGGETITEYFGYAGTDSAPIVWRTVSRTGTTTDLCAFAGTAGAFFADQDSEIRQGTVPLWTPDQSSGVYYSVAGTKLDKDSVNMKYSWAEPFSELDQSCSAPSHRSSPAQISSSFAVEAVALPVSNPRKRNIRPSGITFLPTGEAILCTIDGDLWKVAGLTGAKETSWVRIAAGLHEPQSVLYTGKSEKGDITVFTRDGLVRVSSAGRLNDLASYNFCNAFTQTGETREYAMDMVAKPGGGFYIAKGGQMVTRKTPQGGRVLEVSADGKTVTEICTGLRQPYLGIHPKTGLLTASDQQGHWTPSTPIRYIRPGAYYGFEEAAPRPIPSVIDPPACWIPHEVNQSAAGQVWAVDAKMGPLNDRLLHLMYYRPGILAAFLDEQQKQAATVPTQLQFDFPLLKGAINPVDGLLYVVGFRIWGTESEKMAGMARIRPTGKPSALPAAVRAVPQGVHLRFTEKVDAASLQPGNFTASRWNYKRSSGYGSAHYKLDGTPGVEPLPCTGVQLSADGLGVLVHLPDMKPAEQYRLDWRMTSAAGMKMENFTCLTLYALEPFDAAAAGFDAAFKPKAAAEMTAAAAQEPASAEAGQKLVTQLGCLACHSTNGSMEGMKGPTWKDLYGGEFPLHEGSNYTADAAFLKESILNPGAKVRKGFKNADIGMPPYAGILSDSQLDSVLLYLRSLSKAGHVQ